MAKAGIWALSAILIFVTVLPLVPSNEWWIRIWDFPRLQIAALLILVLIAAVIALDRGRRRTRLLIAVILAALVHQSLRMWPYTPLHGVEAKRIASCPDGSRVRLVVANVLMTNRPTEPLLALIRRLDPDLVLLVETDAWWHAQLAPLRASYPFTIAHPRDDTYGLHLFSRFELVDPKVRFLIDGYVPSIRTGVRLPSGGLIDLHGVHPKPPPHQDTARRDAELLITAREVRETASPSIVAGDLNDVAWSRTTRLFQEVGGLLDPRIGRGFYPTYNANWPLLRWPLDHVFFEPEFSLMRLAVLGDIGSDHFPLYAALCHAPGVEQRQNQPELDPEDLERAREAIRQGREKARSSQ
jgi:endonuclease/exonuclease/phosphatase (EEP) superfamily protein YafD